MIEQHGIWNVDIENFIKLKDGHTAYKCTCSVCGKEIYLRKTRYNIAKKCIHTNFNGEQINYSILWSNQRISSIFSAMKQRCYNVNDKAYNRYGGRGIKICDEWLNNPKSFEEWALKNGYQDSLSIDRIDCNGNYCPENCRWITLEKNAKFKSTTHYITIDGKLCSGKDWARKCEIGLNGINKLLRTYYEEDVIKFIKLRIADPDKNKIPIGKQTWFELYNIAPIKKEKLKS